MDSKREYLFKVLIVGDAEVGKTSMVQRYAKDIFITHYKLTVGVDFAMKELKWSDSETVRLQLWDIAGQECVAVMIHLFYASASSCVVMFDVTNRQSFLSSQWWKNDLDSKLTLRDGSLVPCILLANKCDLSPWEVTKEEIDEFSKKNKFIGWMETSVKENKNVNESMSLLVAKMLDAGEQLAALAGDGDYINLKDIPKLNQGCC